MWNHSRSTFAGNTAAGWNNSSASTDSYSSLPSSSGIPQGSPCCCTATNLKCSPKIRISQQRVRAIGNGTMNSMFVPHRQSQLIVWSLSRDDAKKGCTQQSCSTGRNAGQPLRHKMSWAVLLCQTVTNVSTNIGGWWGCPSSPEVLRFQIALWLSTRRLEPYVRKGSLLCTFPEHPGTNKSVSLAEGQISSCLSYRGKQVFVSFTLLTWHRTSLHMQQVLLSPRALFACQISNPLPNTTV